MVERYRPSKNVMRRFRITELSAVDKPAMEGAKATIIKRDDGFHTSVMGKPAPGEPFRKIPLTRDQIGQASVPLPHADDPDATKLLKLEGVTALTYEEAQHMAKLSGDDRRAFLLSDHATRKGMMPSEEEQPANDNDDEDDEMTTFDEAVKKFAAPGVSRTAAMQKARRAYPALFEKFQAVSAQPEVAKAAKAEADAIAKGAAHRHDVEHKVMGLMAERKLSRTEALRALRREKPEMFEEA